MLSELLIRDVGVIDEVTLRLGGGLNVLTGETGAGKTIVVSALQLLLGARADVDLVRAGAEFAVVEGRLDPAPLAAREWLDDGGDELVVSREVAARGRGRARLGGRLAPVSALAAAVGSAVEIHGQHDATRLASGPVQRALLDRSGGPSLGAALQRYQDVYAEWRAANDQLAALAAAARDDAHELDRLRFELAEIAAVGPVPDEEEELLGTLSRLEHTETLATASVLAAAAIGEEGGARDAVGHAVATLRGVAGLDPQLDHLRERIEGLAAEVQDLGLELGEYARGVELDPRRLEALRERRAALTGLCRKYGPDSAAVAAHADDARARIARLQTRGDHSATLAASSQRLWTEAMAAADALRHERQLAGKRLAEAVGAHLRELAMPHAEMRVVVEESEPGPSGGDQVSFVLAANAGEPALPLAKAASGGERSRVALALRLALAGADDTPVLVFDEVDAGIGGATALAVGRKLAALAHDRQVLCVTHLAQLAAFADTHFLVEKRSAGGRTVATVRRLDADARVRELSRMLSGTPESRRAADHAAELLSLARTTSGF